MRTVYEQTLLEIRQGLKETEDALRLEPCVPFHVFKNVLRFKKLTEVELIAHRRGIKEMDRDLARIL